MCVSASMRACVRACVLACGLAVAHVAAAIKSGQREVVVWGGGGEEAG